MNEEQRSAIRKMLERRTSANTQTSTLARQWLTDEGILDEDGELRPEYGGENDSEDDS